MDNIGGRLTVLRSVNFQRLVTMACALGPRVIAELLAKIGAEFLIRVPIEQKHARYARLDPEILRAVRGDRFPPVPLRLVIKREDEA
jgi:hypothetical protein